MIRVVAHFRPKADKFEEARELLRSFIGPSRADKGCVFYDLHENPAEPLDLTFIEEWDSVEDLDAHGLTKHIQDGRKRMPELMDVVDVRRYKLLQ